MLNSANCLDFTARLCGFQDVSALLKEAEERGLQQNGPLFLPYLSGERTPHNDAHLRGSFTGWSFCGSFITLTPNFKMSIKTPKTFLYNIKIKASDQKPTVPT